MSETLGLVEVVVDGRDDDSPFLRVVTRCRLCLVELGARVFDVREPGVFLDAADAGAGDADRAVEHYNVAHGMEPLDAVRQQVR